MVGQKKGLVSIQTNDNTVGRSLRLEANSGKFLTVETKTLNSNPKCSMLVTMN